MIDGDIGWCNRKRVGSESVGYSASPQPGIAASEHINRRVSDNYGFFGRNSILFKKGKGSEWIRLLGFETVSPLNDCEKSAQSQGFDNGSRRMDWLIGEDGHAP